MNSILPVMSWFVDVIAQFGYLGIFFLMFLESSLFPLPSEVVMVPAGYLVSQGTMNIYLVILAGTLGSIAGALFNYYMALWLGRPFLQRYGKYVLISTHTLHKMEAFFIKHGRISTFIGRLLPGVRHCISIPAGLARMNVWLLITYTAIGSCIWVSILTVLGYMIGDNQELMKHYLHEITVTLLLAIMVLVSGYVWLQRRRR